MSIQPIIVGYLPQRISDELGRWAPGEVSESEMFSLRRLVERAYAAGYDDGHRAGGNEVRADLRRPSGNDVNRLREALAEEAEGQS